ncbi:SAM-dependent methyltransferase [Ornithinimicrobium sp. Y1847]|uniref:SAM-dependent methyltransferase n=1 Tax=Ornithinimicrobium sp. Y1847 TaxID=3405419 RepID=UPI003B66D7B3
MSGPPPPEPLALPWEQAWGQALYGPDGFYVTAPPADHFATSVQGIPGAGELLARAVLALARRHRCTAIVDVGCGRGELLAHLRRLAPELRLTGVDVVPRPTDLDVDAWLVSPGGARLSGWLSGLRDSLVIAHEWLDVVPCPVVELDADVWRVVTVTTDGTEHLGDALTGPDLDWVRNWVPEGVTRAEVGRARDLAFAELVSRVQTGLVVAVDYGHTRQDRPHRGTLTGFRAGREVEPVPDGSSDLTAHVAMDSVLVAADPARPQDGGDSDSGQKLAGSGPGDEGFEADVRLPQVVGQAHVSRDLPRGQTRRAQPQLHVQRDLLLTLRAEIVPDLLDPSAPVAHERARTEPAAYLEGLRQRAALSALTAPGGLGDFHWLLVPRR